jgi:hypothetical protein
MSGWLRFGRLDGWGVDVFIDLGLNILSLEFQTSITLVNVSGIEMLQKVKI